jgi:hypothetical protein
MELDKDVKEIIRNTMEDYIEQIFSSKINYYLKIFNQHSISNSSSNLLNS